MQAVITCDDDVNDTLTFTQVMFVGVYGCVMVIHIDLIRMWRCDSLVLTFVCV